MLFWVLAALVICLSLAVVLRPLVGRVAGPERRASYDMQVYRDQLREVEHDLGRGVLTPDEADATRIEVSRRLLAAADSEAAETADGTAPSRANRAAAAALLVLMLAGSAAIYGAIGAPGLSDQPLSARRAAAAAAHAARPSQAAFEAMPASSATSERGPPPQPSAQDQALLDQLSAVLETRPDDVTGHRLLARSLGTVGRFAQAHAAQGRVIELAGEDATAEDYVAWAELMILAAEGYVSPEAEAALGQAMARDPGSKLGRYYSGLTLLQGGRPDLAYRLWSGLLAEGPPDAPWIPLIEAEIGAVARAAGRTLPPATPGPTADDVAAAATMAPEERQAMIEGMVAGLAARLAAEGGPAEDWARLIGALNALGRRDEAARIHDEARAAFAGNAADLALISAAAREAGLAQ